MAHRGGATADSDGPENSMTAFARAVNLGYRYLETDVVATADGVVLTFHDRTLRRLAGDRRRVASITYAELSRTRIRGTHEIAKLEDVLGTWPDVRVNIDVKEWPAVAPLVETIRRTNALDRVCVASFSERRLGAMRRALGPQLCTSFGPARVALLRAGSTSRLPQALAPRGIPCIQIPERVGPMPVLTPALLELAHHNRQQVHVWTVNSRADMERLLDLGVDGIITDELEVLRDVMTRRDAWPG